jgi:hypothetical protein
MKFKGYIVKTSELLSLKNLLDVSKPWEMTKEPPASMTFPESKDRVLDHDPQKPDPTKAWCPKCKVHSTEIIEHTKASNNQEDNRDRKIGSEQIEQFKEYISTYGI